MNRITEDIGKERIAEGGYGRKQIQELIQNAMAQCSIPQAVLQ